MGNNITESTNIISGQTASFYQTPSPMPLKNYNVDFSPTQSGTPAPDNICDIKGYSSVDAWRSGKNEAHIVGYSARTVTSPTSTRYLTNTYGTTLSTIDFNLPDTPLVITQSNYDDSVTYISHYNNGYFAVVLDNLPFNKYFDISFKVSNITSNLGNAQLSDIRLANPYGTGYLPTVIGDRVVYKNIQYKQNTSVPLEQLFFIYVCGMSFTMSEFMATEVNEDATYRSYHGDKLSIDFPNTFYGGSVDLITGELIQDWYEYVLTGDESFSTVSTGNWVVTTIPKIGDYYPTAAYPYQGFCTHYPYGPYGAGKIGVMYNERTLTFPAALRDLDGWKTYIKGQYNAGTPIRVVYKLKTPIIHDLSTTQQMSTLVGKNYFWSKNDSVEVEYYLHDGDKMSDYRKQISMNEPHLATATGNPANFGTDMVAPIEQCKIKFLPKQEGSGDPSPSNVRAISGWNEINGYHSGKNMAHVVGFSATSTGSPASSRSITNRYGTTIDTTTCDTSNTAVTILQANYDNTLAPSHYRNGYFVVVIDNMVFDSRYNISFRITNITSNPGNIALSDIKIANPWGSTFSTTKVVGDKLVFNNVLYRRSSNNYNEQDWCVYCSGMSFTLSEFMATPVEDENVDFEPYQGGNMSTGVIVYGENLYDSENYPLTDDWWISGSAGTDGADSGHTLSATKDFVPLTGYDGLTIVLNKGPGGTNPGISFYSDANVSSFLGGVKNQDSPYGTPMFATVPSGTNYMRFTVRKDATDIWIKVVNTIYGGYVDLLKGKLVKEWDIVDLGTLSWMLDSSFAYPVFWCNQLENKVADYIKTSGYIEWYVSSFKSVSNKSRTGMGALQENNLFCITQSGSRGSLVVRCDDCSTVSEFTEFVSGVQLCYPIADPVHYTLTPRQLQSFRNTNYIQSNANDDVEVTYWKHGDVALTRVPGDGYTTSDDYLIALSDGYILGEEANYVEY